MKNKIIFILTIILVLALTGCSKENNKKPTSTDEFEGNDILVQKEYDRIIAMIKNVDLDNNTISIIDLETEAKFDLIINGGVDIQDKYGEVISATQLKKGDIIRTKYDKSTNIPESIQITAEIWENKNVNNLVIDAENKIIQRGNDKYQYTDDLLITYNGNPIDIKDINKIDELTLRGYKNKLWVIIMENGHGTVTLQNYEYFIGGTIEIGNGIIETITENMVLEVPVGVYRLKIEKDSISDEKEIMVEKDKDLTLDFSYLMEKIPKVGSVEFNVSIPDAYLYINGQRYSYKDIIELTFGEYKITAEKEGYKKFEGSLTVDSTFIKYDVNLEKNASYINISTPKGAEVYLDGNFVGIVPIAIEKEEGQHSITFRKDGYEAKTYYIDVINDGKDAYFSFPELSQLN